MRPRRSYSVEQKLQILQEAEQEGLAVTFRKYELSQALYYRWKHKFDQSGSEGLKPAYHRIDPQVRELEEENARLKKIIARQALEIEVKSELLKKIPSLKGIK
jgi:transposase-like protein